MAFAARWTVARAGQGVEKAAMGQYDAYLNRQETHTDRADPRLIQGLAAFENPRDLPEALPWLATR